MKEKKLNDVYMREVQEKNIETRYDESLKAYITVKYINKTSHKCTNIINGRRVSIVDDGYTILEYSPVDKK